MKREVYIPAIVRAEIESVEKDYHMKNDFLKDLFVQWINRCDNFKSDSGFREGWNAAINKVAELEIS